MIQYDFYISSLISHFLSGTNTPEEADILNKWRLENEEHEQLFVKLCNYDAYQKHQNEASTIDKEKGWKEVQLLIRKRTAKRKLYRWMAYAAMIIIPVIIASIVLTEKANPEVENLAYKEISMPLGKEGRIVLPDGTAVTLNSMSRLRYPSDFHDDKRKVELEGEGYFEVTKTGKPFIVSTDKMDIQVLGTSFNVSAYPDEDVSTTLVTGKISIDTGCHRCILKPSEKATLSLNGNLTIEKVDTYYSTSWMDGTICFRDESLGKIMTAMARWYDIDVSYENESLRNMKFGCKLERSANINQFIKLLEKTETVKTRTVGKKIIFYN